MKPLSKNVIFFILAVVIGAALFSAYSLDKEEPEQISMGVLAERIQAGQVTSIEVEESEIKIEETDDTPAITRKEGDASLSETLRNYGVTPEELRKANITVTDISGRNYLLRVLLPSLLPLVVLILIFWFMIRQMQGMNSRAMTFGQSGAKEFKDTKDKATFDDVAGAKEAKNELKEVVEFLKNPQKFSNVGAELPKGVLLMGRPGTGKTLLARAVAGEAKVPFYHISGSEFVEMFVGVGASRVRDLFDRAKKSAPCIIFIDEIDAVGRQRGAGLGGSHDEREQTLNQILTEMDGFDPNIGIIVMAATNRPDVLDPALLRPGRFDRRVVLDMPDIKEREAILKIHAKNKPLTEDIDLNLVAQRTPGFSGADLENLLNEAAIRTAMNDRTNVTEEDILESIEKVMLGPARKSRVISDEEKKITAYHEAGHALVAHMLPNADPVHKVSIISRGAAGGYTLKLPEKDRRLQKRAQFIDDMAVMLGGYVAESVTFGDITTGASSDLQKCTQTARKMVTRYGMSDRLGPRIFGESDEMIFLGKEIHENRNYSEKTAERIDQEIDRLVGDAKETAEKIMREHKDKLEAIVEKLMDHETIEKDEFEVIFKDETASDANEKQERMFDTEE